MKLRDCVLCFDFGAGSGRLMAVFLENGTISYHEVHRFTNEPMLNDSGELCWRALLWQKEMQLGLALAQQRKDWRILSIGVDTWGVDMAYWDAEGKLLHEPFCYRSKRTQAHIAEIHAKAPLSEMYAANGVPYFPFNSVYQLYSDFHHNPRLNGRIAEFVFTPDFLMRILAGQNAAPDLANPVVNPNAEYCIASTSGLCDARTRSWNWNLIDRLGLPKNIFPPLVEAPYFAGELSDKYQIADAEPIQLIKVASHDTASAVASIALTNESCFLSCGTWFIMGIEDQQPALSEQALAKNITNEAAALGKYRVQDLFCGFWLQQQLLKEWNNAAPDNKALSYRELGQLARHSRLKPNELPEFSVSDESLLFPKSMEQALGTLLGRAFDKPDLLRVLYYNMARACTRSLASICEVTCRKISVIHALGGGSQDAYFLEELKRVSECTVIRGPIEASVLGNAAMQFLYHGKISSLQAYRDLVTESLNSLQL